MKNVIAWTGGSRPEKLSSVSAEERKLVRMIFRESMADVFAYWGDYRGLNESALDMARVQFNRARYDAHATIRNKTC